MKSQTRRSRGQGRPRVETRSTGQAGLARVLKLYMLRTLRLDDGPGATRLHRSRVFRCFEIFSSGVDRSSVRVDEGHAGWATVDVDGPRGSRRLGNTRLMSPTSRVAGRQPQRLTLEDSRR